MLTLLLAAALSVSEPRAGGVAQMPSSVTGELSPEVRRAAMLKAQYRAGIRRTIERRRERARLLAEQRARMQVLISNSFPPSVSAREAGPEHCDGCGGCRGKECKEK